MLATTIHAKVRYVGYGNSVESSFHESMMRATFEIEGPKLGTRDTVIAGARIQKVRRGTAFLVYLPVQLRSGDTGKACVLVTARHVLDSIRGDSALIYLRTQRDSTFRTMQWQIALRTGSRRAWSCLHDASIDLAVIPFVPPVTCDCDAMGEWCIATDIDLTHWKITAGEELFCLGFPWGATSDTDGQFPVLRSGALGSYPVTPMSLHPKLGFDFEVYPGNSGGPAYVYASVQASPISQIWLSGMPIRLILGVVTQEVLAGPDSVPIKLARIVPAFFIEKTLDQYLADNGLRRLEGEPRMTY